MLWGGVYHSFNLDTGLTYNIHFGENAPTDTTKIWCKTSGTFDKITLTQDTLEVSDLQNTSVSLSVPKRAGTCQIGDNLYIVGGQNTSDVVQNTILRYNLTSQTLTTEATLPQAIYNAGVCAVGSDIYICGGRPTSSTFTAACRKYNIVTKQFTTIGSLPRAMCICGNMQYVDGKLICVYVVSATASSDHYSYVYSIKDDTWGYEDFTNFSSGYVPVENNNVNVVKINDNMLLGKGTMMKSSTAFDS